MLSSSKEQTEVLPGLPDIKGQDQSGVVMRKNDEVANQTHTHQASEFSTNVSYLGPRVRAAEEDFPMGWVWSAYQALPQKGE